MYLHAKVAARFAISDDDCKSTLCTAVVRFMGSDVILLPKLMILILTTSEKKKSPRDPAGMQARDHLGALMSAVRAQPDEPSL
ncbi:hypothetical protein NDU88_000680 [Pleurodeles waltl]|uniref:Uncharacterized protein n=1 Tax=Pleurodeles waltl TaxID=8319 RepID=A0AAV7WK10_PLEWA|nr:hypothetical protein NDU88_000680 [Pleurodeles waltl]